MIAPSSFPAPAPNPASSASYAPKPSAPSRPPSAPRIPRPGLRPAPLCWVAILSWIFALTSIHSARAEEADAVLEQFFRRYFEQTLQDQPLSATRLGDHRQDHRLDDLSPEALKRRTDFTRATLKELPKAVDYRKLSRNSQIDFEIFEHELITSLWLDENTRPFEEDPRLYGDYISESIFLLFTQSPLPLETNVANAIARIGSIPDITAAARRNLRNPPRPVLQTAIQQNRGAITFFERDLFTLAGNTTRRADLEAAAKGILPALRSHQDFLENELRLRATDRWRLGPKRFAKKLELVLDAGLDAATVLDQATGEFARVTAEMHVIARQLWSQYFPGRPLPPEDADGRRETIRKVMEAVGRDHGSPDQLVADARATVVRIKAFIQERDLLRLPDPDRCLVIEMPEFQRGNSLAYLNSAPPLSPESPSLYAISPPAPGWAPARTQSLLEEYNRHMLQVLTIHEAYPGHYVQLEYANRHPSLIRRVFSSGPFVEGWAVYTEQTMLDEGYGDRSLPLRLMQLKFYLRAVGNAILDHRMHGTDMSDDEALKFLTVEAFQTEEEARLKIVRAKQTSCQLSTYFVGRMAHHRLRQEIQREEGRYFDLGRYHEAVLAHGSVPVKYLPELVRTRLRKPR